MKHEIARRGTTSEDWLWWRTAASGLRLQASYGQQRGGERRSAGGRGSPEGDRSAAGRSLGAGRNSEERIQECLEPHPQHPPYLLAMPPLPAAPFGKYQGVPYLQVPRPGRSSPCRPDCLPGSSPEQSRTDAVRPYRSGAPVTPCFGGRLGTWRGIRNSSPKPKRSWPFGFLMVLA